jgi:signal transduction histidine kinase
VTERRAWALGGSAAGAIGAALAVLEGLGPLGASAGAVVGGALAAVPVRPRLAWSAAAAAGAAVAPVGLSWGIAVLLVVHAFCAARFEPRVPATVALVALLAAMELAVGLAGEAPVPGLVVAVAAWAAGVALRDRSLVAAQLEQRARELEEERDAHAELSVRYERARIASDLHDIVAHAVSVMVIQAGAGQRVAHDPGAAAQTLDAIAGAAREAERDMGRLVTLLGDEPGSGPPSGEAGVVEQLVARAAAGGLDVTLRLEGDRDRVPADVADAVFRVVQEGLTNALRYAAGAAVAVVVRGVPGAVEVAVENGPAGDEPALAGTGTGAGVRGLRERVGACGGTLEAGPLQNGGWRLAARLPLPA